MSSRPAKGSETRFLILVYRMPAKPTAGRVAVWRQLKKTGAIYLQQAVCVFPDQRGVRRELAPILERIEAESGSYHLLALRRLPSLEQEKLVAQFQEQVAKHYAEIIENCEINFQKEIEFEVFRGNLTYEEAEEIRSEFEKIVAWFDRVQARDWFGAPNRSDAKTWVDRSRKLLEDFEQKVFNAQENSIDRVEESSLVHSRQPKQPKRTRASKGPKTLSVLKAEEDELAAEG